MIIIFRLALRCLPYIRPNIIAFTCMSFISSFHTFSLCVCACASAYSFVHGESDFVEAIFTILMNKFISVYTFFHTRATTKYLFRLYTETIYCLPRRFIYYYSQRLCFCVFVEPFALLVALSHSLPCYPQQFSHWLLDIRLDPLCFLSVCVRLIPY